MSPAALMQITRTIPALFLFALTALVHAQALPAGVQLGMSAEELRSAGPPGFERVARPQRLAGGLTGSWRGAPATFGGLRFEPVYYFAGDHLRRVEWTAAATAEPDLGAGAFAEIVAWGRGSFGPELASSDPGSAYAAWVQGDADVYAQRTSDPRHASVRLVYKSRQTRDASEL